MFFINCYEINNDIQSVTNVNNIISFFEIYNEFRDRLIHLFNAGSKYNFLATLDDHSSSITAVRFLPALQDPKDIQMVSCGADKSIIFRDVNIDNNGVR